MTHQLVDTGPLVAFLNRRDHFHDWAVTQLGSLTPPLLTCEPVLAEALFLFRSSPTATSALLQLLERRIVVPIFRLHDEIARISRLLRRYSDVEMSLADACLVRMTELHVDCRLYTLDSDFRVYRRNGRQVVPAVMPAS